MEEIVREIETMASALVMLEEEEPSATWEGLYTGAMRIHDLLLAKGDIASAELAEKIGALFRLLARGEVPTTNAVLTHIHKIFPLLHASVTGLRPDPSSLKEVLAHASLFLRDFTASEELPDPAVVGEEAIEEEFLHEIEARIEAFENRLFAVVPPERDPEVVRAIFREIHTLKGEAGIVGLKALSDFCHQIESVIEPARHGRLLLTGDVVDALLEMARHARTILRRGASLSPPSNRDWQPALERLVAATRPAVLPEGEARPSSLPSEPGEEEDFFAEALPPEGKGEEATPIPSSEERESSPPEEEIEDELPTVALGIGDLDRLIELAGEVSSVGSRLADHPYLQSHPDLLAEIQMLSHSCRALEEFSARLRMTPLKPLFYRFQRAAHDAARQNRKRISLHMEGASTAVDRTAIDPLTVALLHLARNAVDHGLETPEERRKAGKSERGQLLLRAYPAETDVIIEVQDDGRGLDFEAIRAKAVALGLIQPQTPLSEEETKRLIFHPGLSTAKKVTGVSGRGIGMQAVEESLQQLRGHIEIETRRGEGTLFRLRFPAALTAFQGLLTRVGNTIIAFPAASVRETLRVRPEDVGTVEGRGQVVTIRGIVVPLLHLGLHLQMAYTAKDPSQGVVALLEDGRRLCAVFVDEILAMRQIVVRPLEGALGRIPSLSGIAILPDRRVALVVESRRLLDAVSVEASDAFRAAADRHANAERQIETVRIGENAVGMIDFAIRCRNGAGTKDHLFAINAFKAREFVPATTLTSLPHAPPGFAGMLLLREKTLPVVSLAVLLGFLSDAERNSEWEKIIVVCEFAGTTVGFLVHHVNRVSYISWSDILPPPATGGLFRMEYVVGAILVERLREGKRSSYERNVEGEPKAGGEVVFVLDFERIVQQVLRLYREMGGELSGVQRRKDRNRILLVEDSSLIRHATAKALREAGMEVIEAENGQDALDRIQAMLREAEAKGESIFSYLDLILSDIEMPRLDGYTLAATVKKDPRLRVLPVLLHSSLTNETMVARAREVEADGFVPKCDPKELAAQLRKYL